MPSHHFNGQCCYMFQIIFQSHYNCLIRKLFQGVFCLRHYITKLLKLAQSGMALFYFLKNPLVCSPNRSPPPPPLPTEGALALLPSPQCWHLQPVPMRACGIVYAWQLNSRLFFLKCWQPCCRLHNDYLWFLALYQKISHRNPPRNKAQASWIALCMGIGRFTY